MKVLFVKEVLGLSRLDYSLKNENPKMHDQYLEELLDAQYLEDITEYFTEEQEKEFLRNSAGFLEKDNCFYSMPMESETGRKMRVEEKGIKIIEKYNNYLKTPMNIQFEEINNEDYNDMIIVAWEDGSESVIIYKED